MIFADLLWFALAALYIVSYVFVLVFVISDVFRDDTLGGVAKAAWLVALVFVPFLTGLIYVIARGSGIAARANAARRRAPEDDSYRPAPSTNPTADIAKAKQLLDAGTISQGEFDALKSKALGNQYFGA